MAKTMRDVWDGRMKAAKGQKVVLRPRRVLSRHDQESLAKQQKYLLEHRERKKMVTDFFPDYQRYLGKGGFTKV